MSHIVEFSISGLAGRDSIYSQVLNRDLNVFFGLNGSGKSSLLKIFHSAMSGDARVLLNVPFKEATVVVYSLDDKRAYEYTIKKDSSKLIKALKNQKAGLLQEQANLNSSGNLITRSSAFVPYDLHQGIVLDDNFRWKNKTPELTSVQRWRHRYLPISRLYLGQAATKYNVGTEISEEQLDARFSEILQNLWLSYSYDINTNVRQAQQDGLTNILQEILAPSNKRSNKNKTQSSPDIALEKVKSFLVRQGKSVKLDPKEFVERYSSNSDVRNIVRDIELVEGNIEQAMAPIDKLSKLVHQLIGGNKKIDLSGREIQIDVGDGQMITPQQLSSGEKQLLKLLIDVISFDASSVIIDEPELSLHIDWQKTLLENMAILNPDAQLIVATHSPEIMSRIDDSKIFRL